MDPAEVNLQASYKVDLKKKIVQLQNDTTSLTTSITAKKVLNYKY
jgi:hypothetical protein